MVKQKVCDVKVKWRIIKGQTVKEEETNLLSYLSSTTISFWQEPLKVRENMREKNAKNHKQQTKNHVKNKQTSFLAPKGLYT